MTTDQDRKKAAAAIFTAAAEGKVCERAKFYSSLKSEAGITEWNPLDPFEHSLDLTRYPHYWRIKPEPVTRPWSKPEDVPGPVCWLCRVTDQFHLIGQVDRGGIRLCEGSWMAWSDLERSKWTYSLDRRTWHPCTVEEAP